MNALNYGFVSLFTLTTSTVAMSAPRLKCDLELLNGSTKEKFTCEAPIQTNFKLNGVDLEKPCSIDFGNFRLVVKLEHIVEDRNKTRTDLTATIHRNEVREKPVLSTNTMHSTST